MNNCRIGTWKYASFPSQNVSIVSMVIRQLLSVAMCYQAILHHVNHVWSISRKPYVFGGSQCAWWQGSCGQYRGPSGADRAQVGPMLAPRTLLSWVLLWLSYYLRWPRNIYHRALVSSCIFCINLAQIVFISTNDYSISWFYLSCQLSTIQTMAW